MVYKSFDELIAAAKSKPSTARMAVAAAGDPHTIEAVLKAREEGIAIPVLVGDKKLIDAALAEFGAVVPEEDIYDVPDLAEAARKAVSLVVEGKADFLMKGKLDTSVLLKAVVNKECGLGQGRTMSHFTMFQVPGYHKLLVPVDGGDGHLSHPGAEAGHHLQHRGHPALHGLRYAQGGGGHLCGEGQPQDARDGGGRPAQADE